MKRSIAFLLAFALIIPIAACAPAQPVAQTTSAPEATQAAEPADQAATPVPTLAPTVSPSPSPEASLEPEVTPDDLAPLLVMKRSEIEAQFGKGTSVVYETYFDYDDNGEALMGFPAQYPGLKDVWVFYDIEGPDEEKTPYMPAEKPTDEVSGFKIVKGESTFNVKGYGPDVPAQVLSKNKNEVVLGDPEHKNYYLDVELEGLRFIWLSKSKDMTDSWVYACEK